MYIFVEIFVDAVLLCTFGFHLHLIRHFANERRNSFVAEVRQTVPMLDWGYSVLNCNSFVFFNV